MNHHGILKKQVVDHGRARQLTQRRSHEIVQHHGPSAVLQVIILVDRPAISCPMAWIGLEVVSHIEGGIHILGPQMTMGDVAHLVGDIILVVFPNGHAM